MASYKRTAWRGKPLDSKKVKERGSRTGSKFDSIFIQGVDVYRLQQGSNTFRLLRDEDSEYWAEVTWVHSYIGSKSSTYLCPKMMGKSKTCPICDAAEDAARQGDKDEKYALEAKERAIAWVVDRENEKDGIKVFDMSWSMDRDIAAACEIKKTGKTLDVTDPVEGYDISVSRSGNKKNTKYFGLQVDREPSPLSDDQKQADAWLREVQKRPLLSLLKFRDSEYLAGVLNGKIEERDEDDDDVKSDKRGGSRDRDEDNGDDEKQDGRGRGRDRDDDDRRERGSRRDRDDDDDRRGRGRSDDRDDDDDKRGSRRGSSRDDDDDRRERGRGDDRDEDRSSRRRDDDDRSSRRRDRDRDDDDDKRESRRGSSRDEEPEDDPDPEDGQEGEDEGEAEEEQDEGTKRTRAPERERARSKPADDEDSGRSSSRRRRDDDEPKEDRRERSRRDDDDEPKSRNRDNDDDGEETTRRRRR